MTSFVYLFRPSKSSTIVNMSILLPDVTYLKRLKPQQIYILSQLSNITSMAEETAEPKKLPQRNYGKVIISLENCIFDREKLKTTASKVDGLDLNTEISLRILGCEYIQTAGILLRLPQASRHATQLFEVCQSLRLVNSS